MSHTAQFDAPRARTARSLRPTIGLLTAGLRDPYATVTWSGVMEVAQARDANVVNLVGSRLHSPLDLEAPAQILFELVEPAALDGLVVFSEMLYHFVSVHELKRFLARYGSLPMTSIGLVPGIPSVMVDLRRGVREVVSHLIDVHGFRRLAFLRGPGAEITAEAQYEGYVEGLAQFRIPLQPHLITPPARHWGSQIGSEGIRTLLDERGLRPGVDFQALVGCGDHESLAAIAALRERGWRVPADVAVTGFNNLEETRFAMPGVTTVDRQIADLSRQATQMLLDLLAGRRIPQRTSPAARGSGPAFVWLPASDGNGCGSRDQSSRPDILRSGVRRPWCGCRRGRAARCLACGSAQPRLGGPTGSLFLCRISPVIHHMDSWRSSKRICKQ